MATKKKVKIKKGTDDSKSFGSDGVRPLTKAEKTYMKKHKIGLAFRVKKGDKMVFMIGRKTVLTLS